MKKISPSLPLNPTRGEPGQSRGCPPRVPTPGQRLEEQGLGDEPGSRPVALVASRESQLRAHRIDTNSSERASGGEVVGGWETDPTGSVHAGAQHNYLEIFQGNSDG